MTWGLDNSFIQEFTLVSMVKLLSNSYKKIPINYHKNIHKIMKTIPILFPLFMDINGSYWDFSCQTLKSPWFLHTFSWQLIEAWQLIFASLRPTAFASGCDSRFQWGNQRETFNGGFHRHGDNLGITMAQSMGYMGKSIGYMIYGISKTMDWCG